MKISVIKRAIGGIAAGALVFTLSACLLSPGKFVSDLDVRKSGDFNFSYNGELVFLPLAEKPKPASVFEAQPCYQYLEAQEYDEQSDPEAFQSDGYEERACDAEELAEQRAQWDEQEASRVSQEKSQAASSKAMFGGIDPTDPKAAEELGNRLRRQAGWTKVEYRGSGVYDVEFATSGNLDRDFVFPTLERFPLANALIQVSRHNDGTVRIDAPGFGPAPGPMGMGGMPPAGGGGSKGGDTPAMDGSFSIKTDAEILANNTDEGPAADPAGQRLNWKVSSSSPSAPTALLRLSN